MAQVLSATKQKTKVTTSFQSYEASILKTSWDEEDLLGRGSFATARRCIHDHLGRVVTKCFKVEGTSKNMEKVMRNVEREMKVLYRLKHQHIVAVHGITEWSNCIGIIMEYAEAGNLDFFLWLQGDIEDIPLLLQLRFAHQISDGLRYLHHHDKKRSYLHCDLKPENILLTPDLMVKIADFGSVAIATATGVTGGSFTITSTTQHTPFYTAPELLGNILSDKKPSMDVYSYGMVLYAILTRHPAFSSDDPINPDIIIELIMRRGQKPRQKYLDDVESSLKDKPEDLEIFMFLKDIMVRCWDFEAKNRPDIQQVYNEIDEKLRSLNKSDVTYHISDLKKNEEPKPTPSSVKIELGEFSFPFEVGPQPSAFLPISEQSTSTTSIQDKVNESLSTLTIGESPIHKKIIPSQCKEHVGESVETSEEITFTEEVSKDDFAHPMEFLEHKPSDSSTSKHKCYKRLKKLPETFTAYFFLCEKHDGVKIVEKHVDRKFAHIAENEKENFKKISDQHFYHPNVVQYYDTVTQGEYTSLYMELCHGDLAKWVDNKLPECKLTSFEICQQATEGIYHLHMKCNMIHRDVKPSNFLVRVDEDGATVKVSDFGLSKALPKDASKVPTASTSTASYMAPEHHLGKDERIKTPWRKCSDIFSLGITFYHILTRGGHPFGATHAEQVYRIQDKKSPVLDFQECSGLPSNEQRELACDLIKKMLDFDPKNRPTIENVKKHPFFWDSKKKFFFYKDANECFHQLRRKNLEKYQESLQRFARFDISVDNIPEPLRDSNLEDFPITEKKCRNVHHLVNRIRDMNEHATKKSEPSKLCLGVSENGSIDYGVFLSSLTGPYPRLLAELYECLSEEAIMQSFY
ncbi:unnamed protein product [Clavelina lepadiformis]|uniref:Protein kinase domain-containing protein n=1 Tax=Clavelina lepadiformis TaxID=159417 RepID=A0ABP0FRD8_CLALP